MKIFASMVSPYVLEPFDPSPLRQKKDPDPGQPSTTSADHQAFWSECKYQFQDESGRIVHEYKMPSHVEISQFGGYVGKVAKYRDPALLDHLTKNGISKASFASTRFPILATRSPQIDLILFDMIQHLRKAAGLPRVKILDHGCSVGEHYDLLDTMLRAASGGREGAADVLDYTGIDCSEILTNAGRFLHSRSHSSGFRLIEEEGSESVAYKTPHDISLSIGVINHVLDPLNGLRRLLEASRHACVLALWMTPEPAGRWSVGHGGSPFYHFCRADLKPLQSLHGGYHFWVADFIPDTQSTQPRSYVGVSMEELAELGCYILIGTTQTQLPFPVSPLFPEAQS